jgi:hypothetical protein
MHAHTLSIKVVGLALSALFGVTYVLVVLFCALVGLFAPASGMMTTSYMMSNALQAAMPGFGWHVAGFVIGLVLTIVYGFYIAVTFVPVYNFLQRREAQSIAESAQRTGEPAGAYS